MSHMHTAFLRGKLVSLRAIDDAEIPLMADLINDPDVYLNLLLSEPNRETDTREFIEKMSNSDEHQLFTICSHDDRWLGMVGLHSISSINRNATSGLWIGRPEDRGKGYATDAKMLLCYHAFCTLNLHRLYTYSYEFNIASQKFNERCGYKVEGRRREHLYRAGRYWDSIETGLLRSEWLPLWETYRAEDPAIRVPEPKLG
ncbi:MAG: GNAT family N-acetyltransferase [Calditrichaeota bacterium]|nr:GNAT family N-acetyltransferase [Calditrichota bacterium]